MLQGRVRINRGVVVYCIYATSSVLDAFTGWSMFSCRLGGPRAETIALGSGLVSYQGV